VHNREPKAEKPDWPESIFSRYRKVERIVAGALQHEDSERPTLTERIDAVVTHRFFGPIILVGVMLLIFQTIFSWASLPMNLIERLFGWSGSVVEAYLPPGLLADLLVNGVIAGVGGVLVFLPQILLLFFFISILEDSGYMSRAAFLMDRLMRTFGLHGKSFMPLMSSFACAVPGIMATRTIENPKDRLVTIMVAPFMSCSARLPVYTLMIATFFAEQNIAGLVSMGVLVMLAMYVLGISVALVAASIMKHTMTNVPSPPFVMELPAYRLPDPRNVIQAIWGRVTVFVKRAGTVILAISILLWALTAFPRQSQSAKDSAEQIRGSYAGQIGVMLEPAIQPLGFDWSIGIGLISSFVARETIISTLGIVYGTGDTSLPEALRDARRSDGTKVWTPLVALSLMIFFVLACQCTSTLAVVKRETNSWRWPLFMIAYMMALAYVASLITYQGGRLLGFS
jgi:ferrous iron transport protein B